MKTVVYIDSLFLLNFIINMIILKLTDVFSSSRTKTFRICLASSVGALYAVCMFFPKISFLYILPFKMLVSVFIVYITDTKFSFGQRSECFSDYAKRNTVLQHLSNRPHCHVSFVRISYMAFISCIFKK